EVHERFLGALAALHRFDWRAARLDRSLRTGLRAELAYWRDYVDWSTGGDVPAALSAALDWCWRTMPRDEPMSLLWGDARLGNVLYDDDARVVALLDWE